VSEKIATELFQERTEFVIIVNVKKMDNNLENWIKNSIIEIKKNIEQFKVLNNPFYKVKGASVYLGLSERRVYSLVSDGDLAYYKNKKGKIRFSKKQLDDLKSFLS
jgi:excisionase family DNA binding protein